jgi:hypothetical protein
LASGGNAPGKPAPFAWWQLAHFDAKIAAPSGAAALAIDVELP